MGQRLTLQAQANLNGLCGNTSSIQPALRKSTCSPAASATIAMHADSR